MYGGYVKARLLFYLLCLLCVAPLNAHADDDIDFRREVVAIITESQENCLGIADKLSEIQKMAGINTVVTGIGTLAAGGALVAGISKSKIDRQAEELEKQMADIANMSDKDFLSFLKNMAEYEENLTMYRNLCSQKKQLDAKSKKLGNIRTGLMVGNTATAIAGTVIANKNKNATLPVAEHMTQCLKTMEKLTHTLGQARVSDPASYDKLDNIHTKCSKFYTKHLDKISNNSKAAMISSAINIGTGTVGTITSAAANSNSTRRDNTETGREKEKHLNNTANVFAGLSTAASGVSTVFNALTIKAVKDNMQTAIECEEALQ